MKYLLIILIVLSTFPAAAQSPLEECAGTGDWFYAYRDLMEPFMDLWVEDTDSEDEVVSKTVELYQMNYQLIILLDAAPTCAHGLIEATIVMVDVQADWGMLMMMRNGGVRFTSDELDILRHRYNLDMGDATDMLIETQQ